MTTMDINEFEIRYEAYTGLNEIIKLGLTSQEVLSLVPITNG